MQKERKNQKTPMIAVLIYMVMGAACGFFGVLSIGEIIREKSDSLIELIWSICAVMLLMYLAMFLQIIVHESGHLLFGLLSGYGFCSFRVGNILLVKRNGKFHWKTYSLMGTAGQCLLAPPELPLSEQPVMLYHLGGSLMNVISAVLFFIWRVRMVEMGHDYVGIFFLCMGIFGMGYGLMNAIPMHMGAVNNDGYNAMDMRKNQEAKYACYLQLKINEQITQGKHLRDMPEEWFVLPTDEELQNSLNATIGAMCVSRAMDEKNFEQAEKIADKLLKEKNALVPVQEFVVKVEQIFCEIMKEEMDKEAIRRQYEEEQFQTMLKAGKNMLSINRFQYAYTKKVLGQEEKAEEFLHHFEKIAKKYPYEGELEYERELLALV